MPSLPPGPKAPRILQTLQWVRKPIPFMQECMQRYGDCFTVHWLGGPPVVFFSDPEAIKQIFASDPEQLQAGKANFILKPTLGENSVLLLDGARHKRERKLLMPSFQGDRMRVYGEVMREIADRAIDTWPTGRSFPIHEQMQSITLDVILRTVFGMEEGPHLGELRQCLIDFVTLTTANPYLMIPLLQIDLGPLTPWRRLKQMSQKVDELLYAQIARRRAAERNGHDDILAMLIEARHEDGQPMSDVELRDEMMTMLLAGHETTATSLAWTFHRILQHPEVKEKLAAELKRVIGSGPVMPQHLVELEYLDATIKETMRLNPILPLVARRLEEPTRIGKCDLPAGVAVSPCIYLAHRRPDVWPDPERFDPDRFLAKRPGPNEFFPFGGGVRHCLGAAFAMYEMKIVLAQALSRVSLRSAPGHTVRVVRRSITFAPSGGMPVIREAA